MIIFLWFVFSFFAGYGASQFCEDKDIPKSIGLATILSLNFILTDTFLPLF